MNTDAAVLLMQDFLAHSPRSGLDVQLVLRDQHWRWRSGTAKQVASPVFEIGSVGKTLTTSLLALLVQRGQLALTDPVSRFYPDLPWGHRVTLEQLASHTSGLPANPFSRWQLMRRGRQLAEAFKSEDLLAFLRQLPAGLQPGTKAHYSNVGMALLGRILGEVSGGFYANAVQQLILQPLGMQDTHLEPSYYDASRLMQGHDTAGRPVPPFVWRGMEAAGVWRSTTDDMMRFLQAQLGEQGAPWDALARMTTQPRARFSRDTQVGLGWMLSPAKPEGTAVWHSGGTFGQHSMVAWSLELSAAVVVLTNRMPPWWHHLLPSRQLELLPQRLIDSFVNN